VHSPAKRMKEESRAIMLEGKRPVTSRWEKGSEVGKVGEKRRRSSSGDGLL
jgi:hypothetical protein